MGEGAPIVWLSPPPFCHVQLDWEIYSSLTQELIKKHRLIWFDWPGTGLSERERYDFSMDAMIRNTEVVVNKLALKSFTCSRPQPTTTRDTNTRAVRLRVRPTWWPGRKRGTWPHCRQLH